MFQRREKDKTSEKDFNQIEISDLPDKEFKIMVIKMLIDLWRRMNEHSENFNKKKENIFKGPNRSHRAVEYNNCTKKTPKQNKKQNKTTPPPTMERFSSRLDKAEERISEFKDKAVDHAQLEQ